MAVCIEDII